MRSLARIVFGLALLGCSQESAVPPAPPSSMAGADAAGPARMDASMVNPMTDAGVAGVSGEDDAIARTGDAGAEHTEPAPPAANPKRAAFLALLGKIVDPMPALAPMLMPAQTAAAVTTQDFTFSSTPTWRVQGTLRRPSTAAGRLPVAIVLHETGGDRNSGNVIDIANAMVARGFVAVAINGRNFDTYTQAIKNAYDNPGHDYPFLYDTAWDVMRLIDYLVTRDDVDPARIGLTGISKGGMETVLVAAADPRVAAAAPIIGTQSFKWGLENNAFQARASSLGNGVPNPNDAASVRMFYDRVAPGLVDEYDGPDMLPLVSPRPFIVIAGLQDPRNPMPGVQLTMSAAMAAYTRDGAPDHIKLYTANVAHDGGYPPFHVTAEQWLDQWLGNHPPAK